ncbi:MAG: hypothetical protein JXQ66_03195, partial [Campylobacterales bacterium]|nr:hypothetical protein [Campylobacterales bacterium]
ADGTWRASINSGKIDSSGFTSSDISSAQTSVVKDISGKIKGEFYGGSDIESVAGRFELNSVINGTAYGVFGAR